MSSIIQIDRVVSHADMRRAVTELEGVILNTPDLIRPVDVSQWAVTNHFAFGVYGRELEIPEGHFLTGKIHKYSQINVMLEGDLSVLTENGVKRVGPGFMVVSPAGTKRIAYAHKKTRWLTLHGTHEQDVDRIEAEFIAQSEQEFLAFCEQQRLEDVARVERKDS